MLYKSSNEACGVVLVVDVIIIQAALFKLYSCLSRDFDFLQLLQIIAPLTILGLIMPVYTHFISLGLGPCSCFILLASSLR